MNIIDKPKGYATRKNAVARLSKVLGETLDDHRWFIIALSSGRFQPAVTVGSTHGNCGAYAQAGIAVIGS
jgi:hypothetical protein